jgi:hypothetical protein
MLLWEEQNFANGARAEEVAVVLGMWGCRRLPCKVCNACPRARPTDDPQPLEEQVPRRPRHQIDALLVRLCTWLGFGHLSWLSGEATAVEKTSSS